MTINPRDVDPEEQQWFRQQVAALTYGEALKAHRMCEGWSQAEAAQRLGISKQLLSSYETGRNTPSLRKAFEMAQVLSMSPEVSVLLVINDQLRSLAIPLKVQVAS